MIGLILGLGWTNGLRLGLKEDPHLGVCLFMSAGHKHPLPHAVCKTESRKPL